MHAGRDRFEPGSLDWGRKMAMLGRVKFEAFDVVELKEAIPGHDRGARGTIVVADSDVHVACGLRLVSKRSGLC
jgi:hypothetical protein